MADRIVGLTRLAASSPRSSARAHRRGQRLDVPMFETMVGFVLGDHLGGLSFVPPSTGWRLRRLIAEIGGPCRLPMAISARWSIPTNSGFASLTAIGRDDLADTDSRFGSFASRMEHVSYVYGWLSDIFLTRTSGEWIDLLDAADVPVMAMHTFETVLRDPHLADAGFFNMVEHPSEGSTIAMANPVQMSATPVEITRYAPLLGEHTVEVLQELGVPEERIATLLDRGIAVAAGAAEAPQFDEAVRRFGDSRTV